MTSALLRALGRTAAIENHHTAKDPTASTLQALDTNNDGHVDAGEVVAFAQKEGLDTGSATEDFSDLDTNGDGLLDSAELLQVLSAGPINSTSVVNVGKAPKLKEVQPHIVHGIAAEKPVSTKVAKHEARISIQSAQTSPLAAALHDAQSAKKVQPLPRQQPPQTLPDDSESVEATPQAEQIQQVIVPPPPTPVDRMVKHFAQVLRNADIVPTHEDTVKLAKGFVTSAAGYAHGDVARMTVESAAKEVAEQLFIAETAEARARVLDRKAAENRANATVLAKITTQEALNAGAAAAHQKANELLSQIAKLEDQAERAQVRSAALHSKAKLETEEASELMGVADRALNRVPTSTPSAHA
jgi:hypothetical protein